jgi:hypothetical protein
MRLSLNARASRFLFVALVTSILAAIVTWYWRTEYIHPTDWYFWTQGPDAGPDIRSPTRRAIIDSDISPHRLWSEDASRRFRARCDDSELFARAPKNAVVITAGAEWRHVPLCNPAALQGEEFDVADRYFRERVDELYTKMYADMTIDLLIYILTALAIWCALFVVFRTYHWVMVAPGQH